MTGDTANIIYIINKKFVDVTTTTTAQPLLTIKEAVRIANKANKTVATSKG